jgi:hypothetical protein
MSRRRKPSLADEVWNLMSGYVRRGAKKYRQQQRARAVRWARHAAQNGATLQNVGCGHVTSFWARDDIARLAPKTRDEFWDVISIVWGLAGLAGSPPRPPDTLRGGSGQAQGSVSAPQPLKPTGA